MIRIPSVALFAITTSLVSHARENLAAEKRLPEGPGLAEKFVDDADITTNPSVIFADAFEVGELGASWDEKRDREGEVLALVEGGPVGKRCLQVEANLAKNTGGGLTKWFESAPAVYIRFYVKFDPECDYIHHFCTLRANRGLQGQDKWSGFGGAGKKPKGGERFSTALEPWGNWGKWDPPGRWNFYSYWHEMESSPDGNYWGNAFRPDAQPDIPKGQWICAEFMLRHNRPGEADGEQAYWIDGRLRGHWAGINWRTSPTLFANALTLESYVTDRWTKQETNRVFFDNVVIAKEYVGPVKESSRKTESASE